MAHYHARGQLHMLDTRDDAVEQAAQSWAQLTETLDPSEVALISDASNHEINRFNARAQHLRALRSELGELEIPVPGVHYGIRQGDRVILIDQHHQAGHERIENGSRGHILDINPAGEVLIEFDITGRQRTLAGEDIARLRLGYAQHIHRAQGATVTRTLVVTRRLANQQGARRRRGIPRPPRHHLVRLPPRPRHPRPRHPPHQTPRPSNTPLTRTNPIPRTSTATRPRLRHPLPPVNRTKPHQSPTRNRPHDQPHHQPTNTRTSTMSQ